MPAANDDQRPLDSARPAAAYRGAGRPVPRGRWARVALVTLAAAPAIAVVAAALLPSRNRANDGDSNTAKCAWNLHQVGLAILLYQQDHGGRCPDALDDLLREEQITPEVFTCPSTDDTPATRPTTGPAADADVLTPGHCSYVYVGRGLTDKTATPATVVAFEPVSNHGDGCHVLYGDGHVAWVDAKHAPAVPTSGPATAASR